MTQFFIIFLICIPVMVMAQLQCQVPGQCLGIAVGFGHSDDYDGCLDLCKKNDNCEYFTRFSPGGECISFSNVTSLDTSCTDCVSGEKGCSPTNPVCDARGACIPSTVIDEQSAPSPARCLQLCQANPECAWYSFYASGANCILTGECDEVDDSCVGCVHGQTSCPAVPDYTKMMVVGGHDDAAFKVEVVDLSDSGNSCSLVADYPVSDGSAGVFTEGRALVCGGYFAEQRCFYYANATNEWVLDEDAYLSVGRRYSVGVLLSDSSWWVTGGFSSDAGITTELYRRNDGFLFNVDLPESRYYHSLAKVNSSHVVLVGGSNTHKVWIFDSIAETWSALPDTIRGRYHPFAGPITYPNGTAEVVLAGGNRDNTSEIFSFATNSWRMGPELPLPELYAAVPVQFGDTFVAVGGEIDLVGYQNSIIRFDLATQQWVVMDQVLQLGRSLFTAFLVPDDLVQCT